jgi:hypothetical protein
MSPDMNPIEHLWHYLRQKVNAHTPKCQNIQELGTALVQEYLLMDDSQNEAQLMGIGSDHGTFVLLKSHQGHTSQAYSLEKSIPKQ